MTITPTPEIEAAITEQAHQQRTSPERLAVNGLQSHFATPNPTPDEILGLAAQVYAGLSEQDILEVEKIARDRSRFVGHRHFV